MAAAVMQPLSAMPLDREIMAPSPISNNQSRHGRGRHGGSVSKKTRQRGYSIIAERDDTVTRALTKLFKRSAEEGDEQGGTEKLTADSEGWFNCESVLKTLQSPDLSLTELQNIIQSPSSKSRFTLKATVSSLTDSEFPSDYLIRLNTLCTPTTIISRNPSIDSLELLTPTTADLPDFAVYETSYANYPLILASGGIRKAGGQIHLSFTSFNISSDGTETRTSVSTSNDDADICIYIPLRATMVSYPEIQWFRNGNGGILSSGDESAIVSKDVWRKVVARRADIGVLFEEGVVRKEVPVGLRGKGVRGKKGGRGGGRGGGWNREVMERSEGEPSNE